MLNEIFDLFAALDATPEQLDFCVLYGSAKEGGWRARRKARRRMSAPCSTSCSSTSRRRRSRKARFRLLATTVESNPYLGRILTGRITSGALKPNQPIRAMSREGKVIEVGRATQVLGFRGLQRVPVDEAQAGDIVAIAGLSTATVADTLADPSVDVPLPPSRSIRRPCR